MRTSLRRADHGDMNTATTTTSTTTTTDPKIHAIENLYAAYGRRDIEGALADLADDVDWAAEAASNSVPWYGNFHGKADVPRFFAAIGMNVDVTEFTVVSLASSDTDVVATIHWSYTVNATGKRAEMYMQHWWRFANGRVVFFRGSEDSAQSVAAFQAD